MLVMVSLLPRGDRPKTDAQVSADAARSRSASDGERV
jgi:hypothetical protein